jgi:transposase
MMRYELTDYEWAAVGPLLPTRPHGVALAGRRCCHIVAPTAGAMSPGHDLRRSFTGCDPVGSQK